MNATEIVPLPAIEKAARLIAADNGAFSRDRADPVTPVMKLLRGGMKPEFLAKVDAALAALTPAQLETACAGEAADQMALDLDPAAEWVLTTIFEEM